MRDIFALYAATVVMSAGIAIMQPALPPLVRQWLPRHVGLGTALFTNGLLVGETLPVMVTIPFVLPLVDGSWRAALAIWALPLVLIALVTAVLAPAPKQSAGSAPRDTAQLVARLAQSSDLANRHSARQRQRRLLRRPIRSCPVISPTPGGPT